MTNEEKQLLLKDLCARLPYGVRVFVERDKYTQATLLGVNTKQFSITFGGSNWSCTSNIEGHHVEQYKQLIKPYLRPMSSMTDKEKDEYDRLVMCNASWVVDDWLNSHYLDYRGLIPKGLALAATEDMYK